MRIDNVNLINGSNIANAKIEAGPTFPVSPTQGRMYYLNTRIEPDFDIGLYVFNGTEWLNGDITAVIAGTGLVGGGASGEITLSLDSSYLPTKLSQLTGDVLINGNPANKSVLAFNTLYNLWEPTALTTAFISDLTASATEINRLTGVTSNVQSQLDGKISSITATGDVTGTGGSNITLTLANSGVTAGTYNTATSIYPLTVDAKGRVTAIGSAITIAPNFADVQSKPTSLAGYGITNGILSTLALDNGSLGAPSLAFTNSVSTGLYLSSANILGISLSTGNGLLISKVGAGPQARINIQPEISPAGVVANGVSITGGSPTDTTRNGGTVRLFGGAGGTAANTTGGGIVISTAAGSAIGGAISITAASAIGDGTTSTGGSISIQSGGNNNATYGQAGNISIQGGANNNPSLTGGDISITAGTGATSAKNGTVTIYSNPTYITTWTPDGYLNINSIGIKLHTNTAIISNLGNPVLDTDAANKTYADNSSAVKKGVKAATTANIVLSGLQTIDGVSLAAGTRVLVKNQTTASQNGIYVVASGAWTRANDAVFDSHLVDSIIFVGAGVANGQTTWVNSVVTGTNIGTDNITFSKLITSASTATRLETGRTIGMTGDVTWTSSAFDGTGNVTGTSTLATTGVAAATYGSASSVAQVQFDTKGRAISASSIAISIPTSAVSSGTFADARIAQSNVTQYQTALTITETQITNSSLLARVADNETISGTWSFNNVVTGVTPTLDTHLATKAYVDNIASGVQPQKSVRLATTANITLSGAQTIDGVAAVAGDRVLVKDQTTGSQNGIYVVAVGAWTRATDFDGSPTSEVQQGSLIFVDKGTANASSSWVLLTANPITIGTTALSFTIFSRAGDFVAGAGLTKTGNTFDIGTASSSRIVVNADNIDLATTGVSAASYNSVAVDIYGRVTAGSTQNYADKSSGATQAFTGSVSSNLFATANHSISSSGSATLNVKSNASVASRLELSTSDGIMRGGLYADNTGTVGLIEPGGTLPFYIDSSKNINAVNSMSVGGFVKKSTNTGIAAAGTTLATATALTKEINVVNVVAGGAGVALPSSVGTTFIVINTGANALSVYPNSASGVIDAASVGAAFVLPVGGRIMFIQVSSNQYYTLNATYA